MNIVAQTMIKSRLRAHGKPGRTDPTFFATAGGAFVMLRERNLSFACKAFNTAHIDHKSKPYYKKIHQLSVKSAAL